MGDDGGRRGTGTRADPPGRVSLGPVPKVTVPTGVVGSDWRVARAVLTRLGLTVNVRWENAARPKGTVLRVAPNEGNVVRKDGAVTLTVSNGPGG